MMRRQLTDFRQLLITLALLLFVSACGQKAPLYLPGNPNDIRPVEEPENSADEREEDSQEENIPL